MPVYLPIFVSGCLSVCLAVCPSVSYSIHFFRHFSLRRRVETWQKRKKRVNFASFAKVCVSICLPLISCFIFLFLSRGVDNVHVLFSLPRKEQKQSKVCDDRDPCSQSSHQSYVAPVSCSHHAAWKYFPRFRFLFLFAKFRTSFFILTEVKAMHIVEPCSAVVAPEQAEVVTVHHRHVPESRYRRGPRRLHFSPRSRFWFGEKVREERSGSEAFSSVWLTRSKKNNQQHGRKFFF